MDTPWTKADLEFMAMALSASRRALGWSSPNPAVGCVIVRDGLVLGTGHTQPWGGLHAEPTALADCRTRGHDPRGGTAYVTLMPCAHHGKTPPCTDALCAAGIARVVVSMDDPHPVSGEGADILRAAGVLVDIGCMEHEARRIMAGFIKHVHGALPLVRLKYAMTLDGKIATRTGHSQWITGPEARADVQRLRAESDAVMVGSTTARLDNPRLNVRIPDAFQPRRVVVDSTCAFLGESDPRHRALFSGEAGGTVTVITTPATPAPKLGWLTAAGADIIMAPGPDGHTDLADGLRQLGVRGVRTILCEGGAGLAAALLEANLVD